MLAKDIFHETVKTALIKEGWESTDDPLFLKLGRDKAYVDLGAEKLLTAQRGKRRIAVEVKSFAGASEMHDLHEALGQYPVYQTMLVAVSEEVFEQVFARDVGALLIQKHTLSMLVFDDLAEVILKWLL